MVWWRDNSIPERLRGIWYGKAVTDGDTGSSVRGSQGTSSADIWSNSQHINMLNLYGVLVPTLMWQTNPANLNII